METDQNSGGGTRPKHNQGRQGVDSNGPCSNRVSADDRINTSAKRRKYSKSAQNSVSEIIVPVEKSELLSGVEERDGCIERGSTSEGKNCNGGGKSPLGNYKCDSDAAEDIHPASVYKGSGNSHEQMPKLEDDLKQETTSGEEDQNCASPSRDPIKQETIKKELIKQENEGKDKEIPITQEPIKQENEGEDKEIPVKQDPIKQANEGNDKEIQGDNSGTADIDEVEYPDAKPNGDPTDLRMKIVETTSEKEDRSSSDGVQADLQHAENPILQSTESILEGLSTTNEGGVHASGDANLPLDMTITSAERKQTVSGSQRSAGKSEGRLKSDSLRPVGRMLHDLGLDLVRQQVYKDLIGIQVAKDSKNMLDDKEKEQLKRLTDAHAKLLVKNGVYQLPLRTCRCEYASSSANVMALHEEFGSTYEVPFHACCMCEGFKTRWPSQFVSHVESSHDRKGRVQTRMSTYVCKFCPYEHKNQMRMEVHVAKCFKKFNLNTNLQPLPADCDVPLLGKSSQPGNSHQTRPGILGGHLAFPGTVHPSHHATKQVAASSTPASTSQPSIMEIGGQLYSLIHHNGKALFTSLRSQMSNSGGGGGGSNTSAPSAGATGGNLPRFVEPARPPLKGSPLPNQRREKCEMCDAMVSDREALWIHFRMMHKVELSKVSMIEKEPWMMCDVCMAKFWTYQGLARHSMQLHKRELAAPATPTKSFKCFLCLQVQTNPLNHLSTYHNITLLDMYHSRRCCMCNRRFRAAPAFEEHMVLQHHDIFANKDVLCTVLQALSTALSLKRQETTVQQRPSSTASSTKSNSPRSYNSPGSAGQMRGTTSGSMPSPGQKNTTPGTPSPTGGKGQPDVRKRAHKRLSGEPEPTTKTPPKKTTEEDAKELNKLYKDYADIGRPILRSMRNRLSQGSTEKAVNASPTGSESKEPEKVDTGSTVPEKDPAQTEQDSTAIPESEEPCAKKPCLETLRNNVETNDSESAELQKRLPDIPGVEMSSLPEAQTAS